MNTITKIAPVAQPFAGTVHWLNECLRRGHHEVFSEVITISPALAGVILDNMNADNRPLKWKRDLYAADMRAGRWTFNGEPLLFSSDSLLNDGQNRLAALIDANTPQQFVCTFGLPRESRMSVDQGVARSPGDYLGMGGCKNAHSLAAVTKAVMAYERGKGLRLAPNDITPAEIVARVGIDNGLADATDYAVSAYRHTRPFAAPKIIGAAYYLLSEVDSGDARKYMDAVCIGEGLHLKDPAFSARAALFSLGKTRAQAKMEVIFRGWVAYRQRRALTMAKVLGSFPALV